MHNFNSKLEALSEHHDIPKVSLRERECVRDALIAYLYLVVCYRSGLADLHPVRLCTGMGYILATSFGIRALGTLVVARSRKAKCITEVAGRISRLPPMRAYLAVYSACVFVFQGSKKSGAPQESVFRGFPPADKALRHSISGRSNRVLTGADWRLLRE